MKFPYKYSWSIIVLLILVFNSCKKDDPIIQNDEEVITTLTYTLTPTAGDVVTLSFLDIDGDGGNPPVITGGTLQANTTYTGSLDLKNDAATPAQNITDEILAEDVDHQFFFSIANGLDLTIDYSDQDSNGNPVGLATTLTTNAASAGTLKVTLRHEPNKSASGVAAGDLSNAGGETDIEVTFDVTIQ